MLKLRKRLYKMLDRARWRTVFVKGNEKNKRDEEKKEKQSL